MVWFFLSGTVCGILITIITIAILAWWEEAAYEN